MEVLKQYKSNRVHDPRSIFTCYGINENGDAVCQVKRWDNSLVAKIVRKSEFCFYTEYKEPLKGIVWVNVYLEKRSSEIYTVSCRNKDQADRYAKDLESTYKRLACVEVPWVEGQGLQWKDIPPHEKTCRCGCQDL